ncbi:MAG: hypothetical protein JWO53_472 [Chlamydiia bacterium]|nr:hypothetical protein [Chlamydiia bacterium]
MSYDKHKKIGLPMKPFLLLATILASFSGCVVKEEYHHHDRDYIEVAPVVPVVEEERVEVERPYHHHHRHVEVEERVEVR